MSLNSSASEELVDNIEYFNTTSQTPSLKYSTVTFKEVLQGLYNVLKIHRKTTLKKNVQVT